ncbi:MAG TPA: class II aldolase/adducin family protein [Ktedonobacteraceae bacterium]|nr:class II aldolase/adducin family protein [Ktedonobacteraceae bacterium]
MSVFSAESLQLRRELAYACRILAANGHNDTIYGHVTYREAGTQTFWMKPAALGLDEITPETLIRVDLEGRVVEGELPRHLEWPIHAEILRARPDTTCVVHTHPIYSIAFATTGEPLHALSHEGAQFTPPDVPRFTQTSDLITTRELGEEVARTMNGHLACFLVNHGIVVAGNTIEQAVVSAINLERASQVQLLAAASGQPFRWTSDEEIAGKREKIFGAGMLRNVWNYYCRRIGPL